METPCTYKIALRDDFVLHELYDGGVVAVLRSAIMNPEPPQITKIEIKINQGYILWKPRKISPPLKFFEIHPCFLRNF